MGCDISLHIEIKVAGKWEHWSAPYVGRDYALFERMAGVRGDAEAAIVPPRGLPVDASDLTMRDYRDAEGDAHTASWLGPQEIATLEAWLQAPTTHHKPLHLEHDVLGCYVPGGIGREFLEYPDDRRPWIEDVRLVFWFDN
jgi:hypothetical protein